MRRSIRPAGDSTVVQVVDLVESAYRGERSRSGWTTEADLIDGQRVDEAMVREKLADPRAVLLVGQGGLDGEDDDGEHDDDRTRLGDEHDRQTDGIVACCEVRLVEDGNEREGGHAEFGLFAVSPDQQGQGWGRRMLDAAERLAREEWGAATLQMSVIEQRAELIDWYRRRGYEPTGERRPFPYGDERFGRPRRDDLCFVVLAKSLAPATPRPPARRSPER